MTFLQKDHYHIDDLLTIMKMLRAENGCPWDREQDHASIRKNLIEETYEVCEAIDNEDSVLLLEELGDVLLQVVFHAEMESEAGRFTFDDVADGICKKLIHRHPHIFGDLVLHNSEEVLKNWDKIKQTAKGQSYTDTLTSVPAALPALMRAEKVRKRASRAGVDAPDANAALLEMESGMTALKQNVGADEAAAAEALGDVMFAAVNLSRHLNADAEETLTRATDKYIRRFAAAETLANQQGVDMPAASPSEKEALWTEAETALHQQD